jgi:MFS family permease
VNVLFPFLAFMIEDMGHGGSELGYYAGGLAASFCGAQFCSSVAWGIISDKYGRKPAVIIGTLGAAIGMLIFGFAKEYWQAVLGRLIAGFLSGNLGVLKSFLR